MPSTLFASPRPREFTSAGTVLAGAKLYFYLTGTSTPAATYSNAGRTVAHTHPVVADSGGMLPAIWLDPSVTYDVTLKNSADSTQWTVTGYSADGLSNALKLYSAQTSAPRANVYIHFLETVTGSTKGYVGFLNVLNDQFVIQSNEDYELSFRSNGINRAAMHGNSSGASWLDVISQVAGNVGGAFIRFLERSGSVVKGHIGFANTSDNTFYVSNLEDDAHMVFETTGDGRMRLPLASGAAATPMLAITGDTTTGLYSPADGELAFASNGTQIVNLTQAGISLKDGVTAPGTVAGYAQIYIDTSDGDLKVKFGDGTVKTLATDT